MVECAQMPIWLGTVILVILAPAFALMGKDVFRNRVSDSVHPYVRNAVGVLTALAIYYASVYFLMWGAITLLCL